MGSSADPEAQGQGGAEGRRADDRGGAGRPRPQPQEHLGGDPARPARRRHRAVGIGQVEPGVRHDLRRGAAAVHGVAVQLRQAVHHPGGQARRGLRVRPVAGHLDRAEDGRQQPALDRRHDDRHRQLPEPAVRDRSASRTARAPASRRPHGRRARSSRRSCRCRTGAEVELRAPVFKVYGEELDFVFTELRKKGCRRLIIDGKPVDLAAKIDLDESQVRDMDAVVDRVVVSPKHEKAIKAGVAAALLVGDGLMQVNVAKGAGKAEAERFYRGLCSPTHHFVYGDVGPEWFVFNKPAGACRDLRRPGRAQADAPGAARPRPAAEHPRRVLRQGGVPVQPGHVGRADHVQPRPDARLLARHAVGAAARRGSARDPLRHRGEDPDAPRRPRRRTGGPSGRARRSGSAGSPGGSSGTTAATASGARPAPAWRPGSTR